MGALHEGHLSLVKSSRKLCDHTVVSIFLNPLQFSENEDFSSYPVNLEEDLNKLSQLSVSCVFIPNQKEMEFSRSAVFVDESEITKCMEGKSRPDFFRGVLTIVAKLFNIVEPTHSFFGEKDPSQLRLITKMCRDLSFDIEIIPGQTIREKNGLAMSSRNEYLSQEERVNARVINDALQVGKNALHDELRSSEKLKSLISEIINEEPMAEIDYISIADSVTMQEVTGLIETNLLVSVAVYFGTTRLIDNFTYSFTK